MDSGCLPRGLNIIFSTMDALTWKRRVIVSTNYLTPAQHREEEYEIGWRYYKTLLERSHRYGKFDISGDPGYGNAKNDRMSVRFYRTEDERRYGRRLRALLRSPPRVSFSATQAEPELICLGACFPLNFRFLLHRRSSVVRGTSIPSTTSMCRRLPSLCRLIRFFMITRMSKRIF